MRQVRGRLDVLIQNESCDEPSSFAIYTLSDPRDLRAVRYVGQTRSPRRRFLQHLNTARLWLPDDVPWWFKPPTLRPLYEWIRELHRDEYRLPAMVVTAWVDSASDARSTERSCIHRCLSERLPLLNVEAELLGRQIPLPYTFTAWASYMQRLKLDLMDSVCIRPEADIRVSNLKECS